MKRVIISLFALTVLLFWGFQSLTYGSDGVKSTAHADIQKAKADQASSKLVRVKPLYMTSAVTAAVNLQGQNYNAFADPDGYFVLCGEVKNSGSTVASDVTIEVKLYGSGSSLLSTETGDVIGKCVKPKKQFAINTFAVLPGETGFFKIVSSKKYSQVVSYTCTFSYDSTVTSYRNTNAALVLTGSTKIINDWYDDTELKGDVKNTSASYLAHDTRVYVALKNSSGKIYEVIETDAGDFIYQNGEFYDDSIRPGETYEFHEYLIDVPYSNYSSYSYSFFYFDDPDDDDWPEYTLTVNSSPTNVAITVSPFDENAEDNGNTEFERDYLKNTVVTLTAPAKSGSKNFSKWMVGDKSYTTRSINVTMDANKTATAVYSSGGKTYTLTVKSTGYIADVTVSPVDINAKDDGETNFTRTYDSGTKVSLSVGYNPYLGTKYFSHWVVDGVLTLPKAAISVTMNKNHTVEVFYTSNEPQVSVNRSNIYFTYIVGGKLPAAQNFSVINKGDGELSWRIPVNPYTGQPISGVTISQSNGHNDTIVTVSVDPSSLGPAIYKGTMEVQDEEWHTVAAPVTIWITVKNSYGDQSPFGEFSTPASGANVSSSIPVTGWALDDTGVEAVKLYLLWNGGQLYLGDAVFVEGARPDIDAAYPTYPFSYRAGWGYMLLSNYLPNGGNGSYTLQANAVDGAGHETVLGTKTFTCDNAGAVKPLGAIDTPAQGGTASSDAFANWGWVVTPLPNTIPTTGNTISVLIDGVNFGSPKYNIFRQDIANYFPTLNNSQGAVGLYTMDTTPFGNGLHTIAWLASDNAGNTDGIGSRFFIISNTASSSGIQSSHQNAAESDYIPQYFTPIDSIQSEPQVEMNDVESILNLGSRESGTFRINEAARIQIDLSTLSLTDDNRIKSASTSGVAYRGYMVSGQKLDRLPFGSTLNKAKGIFSWMPAAGYVGEYRLVFVGTTKEGTEFVKEIMIEIAPRFSQSNEKVTERDRAERKIKTKLEINQD